MIKNVVFDIGNVLIHFDWSALLRRYGATEEEIRTVREKAVHHELWRTLDHNTLPFPEIRKQLMESVGPECAHWIPFMLDNYSGLCALLPHTIPLLNELRSRGYRVFALSNFSEHGFALARPYFPFLNYLDGLLVSYEVRLMKPDPAIYLALCDRYGLEPSECLMVDDLQENVDGAKKAGFEGLLFENWRAPEKTICKLWSVLDASKRGTKELDKTYVAPTYARFDLELTEGGRGATVTGADGREYLDFGTGIAVNTFGVSDPVWAEAVANQARSLGHTSNLYYSAPCARLAAALCERTGMRKVFFGNSGAEANECAIKVARKYGHDHYGPDHHRILTLCNSFHGRTITTLAATGQDVFHTDFGPFPEGFDYVPANDIGALKKALDEPDVCALLMECVQGEGGVVPLDPEFVKTAAELCRKKDILLMIDEVQTGNGRTGQLYSYMHYGIRPDVFTTAKGLGGGLPIGACVLGEKVENVLTPGKHGSTFGGNPIACAGAITILDRLDEPMLKDIRARSAYLKEQLETLDGIRSVSGLGFMLGLEVEDAKRVVKACMDRGLLVLTAKTKVRLLPPLNVSKEEIDRAVSILKEALAAAKNED